MRTALNNYELPIYALALWPLPCAMGGGLILGVKSQNFLFGALCKTTFKKFDIFLQIKSNFMLFA
jgi:hypothetical protein